MKKYPDGKALLKWFGITRGVPGAWRRAAIGLLVATPWLLASGTAALGVVAAALPGVADAAPANPSQPSNRNGHWGHFHDDNDADDAGGERGLPVIVLEEAAASAWDDGRTVGTQLQLQNLGESKALDLRVTRIDVDGGAYRGPNALPLSLGSLRPAEDVVFDAILGLAPIDGSRHFLTVEGTYVKHRERHFFRVHGSISPTTATPGPFAGHAGQTVKTNPNAASYPAEPPAFPLPPNAEAPIFVPIGPTRQVFPPTPTGTAAGSSAAGSPLVQITRNTSSANTQLVPPDPNAAAASPDGVVLSTFNTSVSYSTDGGQTFTNINLFNAQPGNPARTSFFPQSDGGLCCDQVVVYLPKQNLFVWLLQYWPTLNAAKTAIASPNRLRIAWATPAAITANFYNAWTYADLTGTNVAGVGDGLGVAGNEWLDYPDLAWSDSFLYVGVDHGFPTPGKIYTGRRIVARMSLADMANASATVVHYDRAELTGSNGLNKTHFIQNAPARMVVGSLDNSSTMRVFTWADSAGTIPSSTVGITSIAQGASYTSIAPDGSDWLAVSFPGNITGGTFRSTSTPEGQRAEYLFAFDAGTNAGGGRPRAYVRMESLTPTASGGTDYTALSEYDIWNSDYAYAMAALGSDGTEIGITLAVGGGTVGYPQEAVGYRNDFVVYQVTSSNATQTTRFGDYLSTRLIPGNGLFFAAEVYDVLLNPLPPGVTSGTCATVGCAARMRYVQFGRPAIIIR